RIGMDTTPGDATTAAAGTKDSDRMQALLESERAILARIAAGAPLREVLDQLVIALESHAGKGACGASLLQEVSGRALRLTAAPGAPDDLRRMLDGIDIGADADNWAAAAWRAGPVHSADIAIDPLWRHGNRVALQLGLQAGWATPIKTQDG